ncbi:MAG: hypothetical protein RQ783_09140, partial [Gammaproteobacteria bacterium]|nr:hypothetical protein [Gammaproteobacteria bacterium]
MAIHDYSIADQNGLSFLSDLNNALAAIVSNNSSATAPTTTVPFMLWADTTANILKQRNATNDGWINVIALGATALEKANNLSDVANAVTAFNNIKQVATETVTGVVEKATTAEAQAGTAGKYPDAAGVHSAIHAITVFSTLQKDDISIPSFEVSGATLITTQAITVSVVGVQVTFALGAGVTLPTLASHSDYKIYATATALTAQLWDTAAPANSTLIGGFHAYHTGATINPHSIWDLRFRPSCSP